VGISIGSRNDQVKRWEESPGGMKFFDPIWIGWIDSIDGDQRIPGRQTMMSSLPSQFGVNLANGRLTICQRTQKVLPGKRSLSGENVGIT
jgi:hypothetical protein